MSLSLFDSMNAENYFLSEKVSFLFFLFLKKVSFHEWGTMNLYTLVNRHTIQNKTTMHRLTDSKNKIIKIIIWTRGPSPHMPKPNPMSGPWAYKLILSLSFSMWDSRFSSLLITFSSEQIKHQFLIHSILLFQQKVQHKLTIEQWKLQ